jgi:mannosyl-3-phosphoglycerate phosphatase
MVSLTSNCASMIAATEIRTRPDWPHQACALRSNEVMHRAPTRSAGRSPTPQVVVFTRLTDSLDVTLDDSLGDRADALSILAGEGVAIVFFSARTRLELGVIQQRLGIREPIVCESGAAVVVPDGYFSFAVDGGRRVAGCDVIEFGESHVSVTHLLRAVAKRVGLRVVGFADLSVSEVASELELPLLLARLVKLREYEEMIRLPDGEPVARMQFEKGLRAAGLCLTPAGARYARVSATADMATAIRTLGDLYRKADRHVRLIGLGQSDEDCSMLSVMDYPVIAPRVDSIVEAVHRIAGGDPRAWRFA